MFWVKGMGKALRKLSTYWGRMLTPKIMKI